MRRRYLFWASLLLLIPFLSVLPLQAQADLAGTYRCASFNVGGRGGRCTSPPLVLQANGSYQMSSEHGKFTVRGNRIFLSESKLRGPGRLLEDGNEIVFQYTYKGLQHTVLYRRQAEAPPPAAAPGEPEAGASIVSVHITIEFSPSDGSVGWINSANLVPEGGKKADGYETLAVTDGKQTVKAYFRAVETRRYYTLLVGSGFETRAVAKIDLRQASDPVKLTLRAPVPGRDRDRYTLPTTGPGYTPPRSNP